MQPSNSKFKYQHPGGVLLKGIDIAHSDSAVVIDYSGQGDSVDEDALTMFNGARNTDTDAAATNTYRFKGSSGYLAGNFNFDKAESDKLFFTSA